MMVRKEKEENCGSRRYILGKHVPVQVQAVLMMQLPPASLFLLGMREMTPLQRELK
jgi:uncharacterized membrane protein YfbV (UPF0208 family)